MVMRWSPASRKLATTVTLGSMGVGFALLGGTYAATARLGLLSERAYATGGALGSFLVFFGAASLLLATLSGAVDPKFRAAVLAALAATLAFGVAALLVRSVGLLGDA